MTLSEFVGPRGHWLLGNVQDIKSQNINFFYNIFKTHGNFSKIRLGPLNILLIADHDTAYRILVKESEDFVKRNPSWQTLRKLLGDSILLADDAIWRQKRKLYAPSFHPRAIEHYCQIMQTYAKNYIDCLSDDSVRDLQIDLIKLTADIVCKCLFDINSCDTKTNIIQNFNIISESMLADRLNIINTPKWWPSKKQKLVQKSIREIENIVLAYVDQEIKSETPSNTLLSLLVHSKDEFGKGLDREALRNETLTLYLAGHETTAVALGWTLYELARHPHICQAAQQEVDHVLQGRPFHYEDFNRLPFLRAILNESLRMYPPAAFLPRQTKKPFTVNGRKIPKGANLVINIFAMHRDPIFFDQPDAFQPERWADQLEKHLPKCQFMPFGAGPRVCIGNSFALVESIAILAALLQACDISQPYPYTRNPKQQITLRPNGSLPIRLHRRMTT